MKRFFILIVSVSLLASVCLSGCSLGEVSRDQELKTSLETTYDDLSSTFSSNSGQYSLVAQYLSSWAKSNNIDITENQDHYMVLTNPATEGYEDKDSTVLQCTVDTSGFNESMQTLAIALTSLLGPDTHGDITVIITESNQDDFSGARAVPEKYVSCDNFINLDYSDTTEIYTRGARALTSSMAAEITMTTPSYDNAFTITMTMADHKDPFDFETQYPNPVEVVGSLLATEKSSGQLFQIASFSCDSSEGAIPSSATAVVVVDDNDVEPFTSRFERSYENMQSRFENLEDDFVYTMTETSVPDSVISTESSDSIISLMYTLQTGIYLQDEETGEILAASDTSMISTANGQFQSRIESRSLRSTTLSEMSGVFSTTSGLCNIQYEASEERVTWRANKDSNLGTFFIEALGLESETSGMLKSTECDLFTAKSEGLNIISYHCNMSGGEAVLTNIINYLTSLTTTQAE